MGSLANKLIRMSWGTDSWLSAMCDQTSTVTVIRRQDADSIFSIERNIGESAIHDKSILDIGIIKQVPDKRGF
jgi:hypothetical protein